MRRLAGLALFVLAATLATSKVGAFPSSRLIYARGEGAESCPAEAEARRAVATRLGYDPFFPSADKTVIAEIARDKGELRGRVAMVDEQGLVQGAREFHSPVALCSELVATMALAISIAIDPTSQASPAAAAGAASSEIDAPNPPPPKGEQRPKAEQPVPRPRASREATASRIESSRLAAKTARHLEPRLGLAMTSSFGTAPSPALGVAASLGLRWGEFSFSVEGRGDWPASGDVATGGSVNASLWSGSVVPCFHLDPLSLCGVANYGVLRGSGDGLQKSQPGQARYAAAGGRVGLELLLWGPLSFRPELDVLANLSPAELRVDGDRIWKTSAVSALVGAGLLVRIP